MLRWLPENVSTYGKDIDSLFYLIYYITLITFILVAATMVIFLIKYRRREGRKATYYHGNTTIEIVWTVATALIMFTLTFKGLPTWNKIKVHLPPSDYKIQVAGKQFNWIVTYPGPDGQFGTQDDLETENSLNVPANQVIHVVLKSKDVIHSFFLPNLRLKQDAVPGREINVWFEATKPGTYELACAELCGFGHYNMRGILTVHSPEGYQAWVKEHWPTS